MAKLTKQANPESTPHDTPAAAPQNAVAASLRYDVKIYPVKAEGSLRANASVNLNDVFAVRNIRIMEGSKGLFVSMPSFKAGNGEYKDICFPCTKQSKQEFDKAVLDAYCQVQAEIQKQGGEQGAEQHNTEQKLPEEMPSQVMGGM